MTMPRSLLDSAEEVGLSTRDELVTYLEKISQNGFRVDNGKIDEATVVRMLEFIGDPDPYLRDELIYFAFYCWICKQNYLIGDELRRLMEAALDERHLFFHIGNREDTTVFTRSFSALLVSLLLCRHRQSPFLPEGIFQQTGERLLQYYRAERDFRGYMVENGWAHSAAHGADALDELALCTESGAPLHRGILDGIRTVLRNGEYLLCHKEPDRMATPVYSIYQRGLLPRGEIEEWVAGLGAGDESEEYYTKYICGVNVKNFVRSLYFKVLEQAGCGDFAGKLLAIESELN